MLEVKIKITKFENIFYISMMKLDTSTETIRELQDHLMVDQQKVSKLKQKKSEEVKKFKTTTSKLCEISMYQLI